MRNGSQNRLDKEAEVMIASRENALEQGLLVDVTEVAGKAGYLYPVALSQALYERCLSYRLTDGDLTDWDRLWIFLFGFRAGPPPPPDVCPQWSCVFLITDSDFGHVKVVREGTDEGDRVITLMLPEE